MGKAYIKWDEVKAEYITTKISQRDLAKKHGIGSSILAEHCRKEGWVKLRKDYSNDCVRKATQKSAKKEVNHLARLISATTKAIDVAVEAFEDEKQFNRYIITEGIGGGATETQEREYAKVDTKALKDLTGVLKDLTALMRDYYNIPTPAQAEAQRIAAARLELEQKKAAADDTDDTLEVVIAGEAEEWAK